MKKKYTLLVLAILFLAACKSGAKKETLTFTNLKENAENTSIKKVDFSQLEPYLNIKDDKIRIINFWASWCKPCLEELPIFEEVYNEYQKSGKNVEVLLVNLDYEDEVVEKVLPILKERKIKFPVVLFDDPDLEEQFFKINGAWFGDLPATLIYKNDKQLFLNNPLNLEQLKWYLRKLD